MAGHKILFVVALVGCVASQLTGTETKTSSTPVPILRNINTQNGDGSYTYGFESADGTYKIETRFANGEIKGKYGYYDSDGVLREATYGGTAEGGFDDTRVPSATIVENLVSVEKRPARPGSRFAHFKARKFKNEENIKIAEKSEEGANTITIMARAEKGTTKPTLVSPVVKAQPNPVSSIVKAEKAQMSRNPTKTKSRFLNFKPRTGPVAPIAVATLNSNVGPLDTQSPFDGRIVKEDVKVVNGRRAVLKKRLRLRTTPSPTIKSTIISQQVSHLQEQRSSEEALRSLDDERQRVLNLFQKRFNIPTNVNPQPEVSNKGFQGHLEIFRQPEVPSQQKVVRTQHLQQSVIPQHNFAVAQNFDIWEKHPYISGYDSNIGAYSVNYGTV